MSSSASIVAHSTHPLKLSAGYQFQASFNAASASLQLELDPIGIPSFNLELLTEIADLQRAIVAARGCVAVHGQPEPIRSIVVRSRSPGVFSLGGELPRFLRLIRTGDRAGLADYARRCIEIVHRNYSNYGLPLTTISLVEGHCFGGGMEAALSSTIVVAERSARFGLPEIQFGLFPGMGAYHLVERRVGRRAAERLILSGEQLSADAAHELGLVDIVTEDGAGAAAVDELLLRPAARWAIAPVIRRIAEADRSIPLETLEQAARTWVDVAMALSERDIAAMERVARAQARRFLAWPARGELVRVANA